MNIRTTTPNSELYEYHPLPSPSIRFRVMASNDAHIILSEYSNPSASDPVVEIFIGGWNNQKSAFRLNHTVDSEHFPTPGILSSDEFRGFWISVDNNRVISVGKAFQATPFMQFVNPQPFPVNHFGIRTGQGAKGEWMLSGKQMHTSGQLEYQYLPMPSFSLDVQVQAAHDAHIALTSGPRNTNPMYEVFIGGWENKQSGIRFNHTESSDEPRKDTPYVLSGTEFRRFHVSWKNGLVELKNGDGQVLVHGRASDLVSVTHLGLRTFHGATGDWSIEVIED